MKYTFFFQHKTFPVLYEFESPNDKTAFGFSLGKLNEYLLKNVQGYTIPENYLHKTTRQMVNIKAKNSATFSTLFCRLLARAKIDVTECQWMITSSPDNMVAFYPRAMGDKNLNIHVSMLFNLVSK